MSERHACTLVGQHGSLLRRKTKAPDNEAQLLADMRELATKHLRCGYPRVRKPLLSLGWRVNRNASSTFGNAGVCAYRATT